MKTMMVFASAGSGSSELGKRACSKASRWEFMLPRLVYTMYSPLCLSYTRSSRTCCSSSKMRIHLFHSGQVSTSAAFINMESTFAENLAAALCSVCNHEVSGEMAASRHQTDELPQKSRWTGSGCRCTSES